MCSLEYSDRKDLIGFDQVLLASNVPGGIYAKGRITIEEAAEELEISVEEFAERLKVQT